MGVYADTPATKKPRVLIKTAPRKQIKYGGKKNDKLLCLSGSSDPRLLYLR